MPKRKIGSKVPVYPMPVILVGAQVKGKPNFLTVVWFSMVNFKPPMISVVLNRAHYTNQGIKQTNTFSINIPSTEMLEATDYCSVVSGFEHDKSKLFDIFYGELRNAPMITECPLTAECRVIQTIQFTTHELFVGEVITAYADDNMLKQERPDITKIKPFIYSMYDNHYWELGKSMGTAMHIGKRFKSEH